MRDRTSCFWFGSRPSVGSSRTRISGSCRIAWARPTRRLKPLERVSIGCSSTLSSSTRATVSATRRRFSSPRKPRTAAAKSRKARVVISEYSGAPSGRYPIRRFAATGLAAMSSPPTAMVPESAERKPVRTFIVVDLPAPLGPRNPRTSPRATEKLTPSTALIGPKCLTRFSIWTSPLISPGLGCPPGGPKDYPRPVPRSASNRRTPPPRRSAAGPKVGTRAGKSTPRIAQPVPACATTASVRCRNSPSCDPQFRGSGSADQTGPGGGAVPAGGRRSSRLGRTSESHSTRAGPPTRTWELLDLGPPVGPLRHCCWPPPPAPREGEPGEAMRWMTWSASSASKGGPLSSTVLPSGSST